MVTAARPTATQRKTARQKSSHAHSHIVRLAIDRQTHWHGRGLRKMQSPPQRDATHAGVSADYLLQSKRHSANAKQTNALKDTEAAVGDRKITANRIKSGRARARRFKGLHVWTPKPLQLASLVLSVKYLGQLNGPVAHPCMR